MLNNSEDRRATEARRNADARKHNVSAILTELLRRGPQARIDLASSLSVTTGAMTRIAAELSAHGLLHEMEPVPSTVPGRRRVPVEVAAEQFLLVGAHIGLRYTTCGLMNLRGEVVGGVDKMAHTRLDPDPIVEQIIDGSSKVAERCPEGAQIVGSGISIGGIVDSSSEEVSDPELLGWHGVNLRALIRDRLPHPMTISNTYQAFAHAEMWFGAAAETASFIHLFTGNAIGAAVVIDRVVHEGTRNGAGAVAHLPVSREAPNECDCGRRGCLISFAGSAQVLDRASAAGVRATNLTDLVRIAASGDDRASQLLRHRAEAIGEAVGILVDVLAPERVVLAGASLLTQDDLALIRETVAGSTMCNIDAQELVVPTELGDSAEANVVASATPAFELFLSDPLRFLPSGPLPSIRR